MVWEGILLFVDIYIYILYIFRQSSKLHWNVADIGVTSFLSSFTIVRPPLLQQLQLRWLGNPRLCGMTFPWSTAQAIAQVHGMPLPTTGTAPPLTPPVLEPGPVILNTPAPKAGMGVVPRV